MIASTIAWIRSYGSSANISNLVVSSQTKNGWQYPAPGCVATDGSVTEDNTKL